ncbi:MAG: potassium transporter TrkH [Lachnospiraceae bacterium]|nr:potassium transporter TrkH [Lachnospiraceae bacterium]
MGCQRGVIILKKFRIQPVQLIPLSFLVTIIIGTLFLMLPISTADGESTGVLTAIFTATTSVCVTGLVVVDTFSHWSFFGQFIIMILAQIGGLGVVSVASMFMIMGKKKFTFGEHKLLGDSLNVEKSKELLSFLKRIFLGVFIVEAIGALMYMVKFIPLLGFWRGIWASIFHSVSAFCNAGMDIVGPNSMIDFQSSKYLMCLTMALIILGGIGFVVWFDVIDGIKEGLKKRFSPHRIFKRFPVHTKLVLFMTISLIILGTVVVFLAEYDNPLTLGNMSLTDKILNSLFQSVTFRTAGFASVSQDGLTDISCLIGYILMFIGGSPVGTAGGVKTVTIFLVIMNAISYIRGKKENVIFNSRVSEELMRKASAVVCVSLVAVCLMTGLLMFAQEIPLNTALYEVVSALGTVGLSKGLTPNLNIEGRIIIIIAMYLGRIGPISMAIFFTKEGNISKIKHAEGTFFVG